MHVVRSLRREETSVGTLFRFMNSDTSSALKQGPYILCILLIENTYRDGYW